jgi:hypothetical protein
MGIPEVARGPSHDRHVGLGFRRGIEGQGHLNPNIIARPKGHAQGIFGQTNGRGV